MFKGKRIVLRGLELSDVDELMKYWNRKEVKQYLMNYLPNSREEEIEWIKATWKARREGKELVFAITLNDNNQIIGTVSLSQEQGSTNHRAELGIVIFNPDYWEKGYGTETIQLMLEIGFNDLNLNSIELTVFEDNLRGQACYKKVGFTLTGRKRQYIFRNGKYQDLLIMDILRSEWQEQRQS